MIYCLLVQAFITFMTVSLFYYFIHQESFDYGQLVALFFFLNSLFIAFNFLYITKNLPKLMSSWRKLEDDFPDSGKASRKSLEIISIFMLFAFTEHFLSKLEDYDGASLCFDHYSTKFEAFTRNIIPIFFQVFAYRHMFGVYVLLTAFYSTVLWNISDVFLITIHIIIYSKLKKFNRKIVKMNFRHDDAKFWLRARQNYVAIHEQVKATNSIISCLVMLSLLNDFYFVCNQVLGAFR